VSEVIWPWVLRQVRKFALNDDATRDLWNRVSGAAIEQQSFWQEYKDHLKWRDRIVHRGETATEAKAVASLTAAEALIDYVERASGAAPPASS
jgi:hypothetical protein